MKKTYISPELIIADFQATHLLANSLKNGGKASQHSIIEADVKESNIWDE